MTPQEREGIQKFYYSLNAGVEGGGHQEIDEQQDMDRIIDLLAQTRRAALLEAAKLVGDYNCMHDHGKKATKACDDVFDELHRLAQEG